MSWVFCCYFAPPELPSFVLLSLLMLRLATTVNLQQNNIRKAATKTTNTTKTKETKTIATRKETLTSKHFANNIVRQQSWRIPKLPFKIEWQPLNYLYFLVLKGHEGSFWQRTHYCQKRSQVRALPLLSSSMFGWFRPKHTEALKPRIL